MNNLFKTISLLFLLAILVTCKKDNVTEEEKLTLHEQNIIDKIDGFMPNQIEFMLENYFNNNRSQEDYGLYLDSIETALDELKSAIQLNFSLDEYEKAMNNSLLNLQSPGKSSGNVCLGLGYSKGVTVDANVSGTIGSVIAIGLQAAGGGGVETIYDFVNLERQIYFYSLCGYGLSFGTGIGAALESGLGFSGINEVITGIRYNGNSSGLNKFEGQGIGRSFSLSPSIGVAFFGGFDIGASVGIGTSNEADADFNGINNLLPCPYNMVEIENGIKSYSFEVSGSLSVVAGFEAYAEILSLNTTGTNSFGVKSSYTEFSSNRVLAGLKMAKEICLPGPMSGITSVISPIDMAASTIAIIYSLKDFSSCPAVVSSIGTKGIYNLTSMSAISGGIIKDDGGSNVTTRGVVWSTSENPNISDKIGMTNDGQGIGEFTSNITNLTANTTYFVRAYAANSAGASYGTQVSFTTPVNISKPTVITAPVTTYSNTSATVGGDITTDGGGTVIERGVYWSPSPNPETTGTKLQIGSGTGPFSTSLTGLNPNTPYYVKAYATNSQGTSYGDQVSFTTSSGGQTGTVTDIEGNVYNMVTIGTQTWLSENLKATKFNDNSSIQLVSENSVWTTLTSPGYCWYNNNADNKVTSGALYNWYTVDPSHNGNKNACPTGWHVPSDAEWTTLTTYLGGISVAGGKLKESGTAHWSSPNTGATNESGFTALPVGWRQFDGLFTSFTNLGLWWSATQSDASNAWYRDLSYNSSVVHRTTSNNKNGLSIRCIKDN